jgi:hypothetical protein
LDARAAERELFREQNVIDLTHAGTAVRLGDVGPDESKLPRLLEDVRRELVRLVGLGRDGDDPIAGEAACFLDEGFLFGGQLEIQHGATS